MMQDEQTPQERLIGGALVIGIEDLDVRDTDVAQLRQSFGRRTSHNDLNWYFYWQLKWELLHPNARLDAFKCEEVIHARNH